MYFIQNDEAFSGNDFFPSNDAQFVDYAFCVKVSRERLQSIYP
jgi:hypothetical protein